MTASGSSAKSSRARSSAIAVCLQLLVKILTDLREADHDAATLLVECSACLLGGLLAGGSAIGEHHDIAHAGRQASARQVHAAEHRPDRQSVELAGGQRG